MKPLRAPLPPAQGPAGGGPGGLAVAEGEGSVDEDVPDTFGQGAALLVGRSVGDGVRVDQCQVGDEAGPDQAAVDEAEAAGGVGGQVGGGLGPVVIAELS